MFSFSVSAESCYSDDFSPSITISPRRTFSGSVQDFSAVTTSLITGRRTTIVSGREADYARIHASIPPAVEAALRANGVNRWHIWRDGKFLFHSIETTHGYEAMATAMKELGTIDAEWDELIASLLDSQPAADVVLPLIWSMS
jgi:L-rhamnose mutarotase